jgi:hypothetical protein
MIQCGLRQLEVRCRQRGYTLDEVRPCIVSEDGDTITVDVDHQAYPRYLKPGFQPPRELPPLAQRVANFAASAATHVAAGMPRCTDEQIAERFAICQGCEFLSGGACSKCGCPVVREARFVSKLSWANESCPVGKWGPVS